MVRVLWGSWVISRLSLFIHLYLVYLLRVKLQQEASTNTKVHWLRPMQCLITNSDGMRWVLWQNKDKGTTRSLVTTLKGNWEQAHPQGQHVLANPKLLTMTLPITVWTGLSIRRCLGAQLTSLSLLDCRLLLETAAPVLTAMQYIL